MHRSILIHTKNTPNTLHTKFNQENIIEFDYSNSEYKSIDEYISKLVIKNIKSKKIELIYIKDNLSSNYLELYGLRLAYHIRLTTELKFLPIVIFSDLDGCSLSKLEPILSRIIFTKNVFLEPNSEKSIEKYEDKVFSEFDENNYKNGFLDLIQIDSPENSTNHSIANEWAIFKWANILEMYHPSNRTNINQILNKISFSLYFKYLKTKNNIDEPTEIDIKSLSKYTKNTKELLGCINDFDGNILYIDDDHSKGWEDIFNYYFSLSKSKDKISILDFSNLKTYNQVEEALANQVKINMPDLILLDMRLIESDKNEEDPENISGIELLKKIKSINPGIQVIMLSATTRSDILEQAYKNNKILGYIKKDHLDNNAFTTKENIEKLSSLLKDGEEKFYLKDIWNIQQEILKLDIFSKNIYNEIKTEVEFIFELLDSSMEKKFKFAMLTIYKVLEIIKDIYIDDKSGKYLIGEEEIKAICLKDKIYIAVKKDNLLNKPEDYGFNGTKNKTAKNKTAKQNAQTYYNSTTNKICSILYEKLGFIQEKILYDDVVDISKKRNRYIHPDKGKTIEVEKDDILKWFKMLQTILSKLKSSQNTTI